MRTRSNRSVVIVIFICLLVAAVIAYRTKQVGVRDFPRSAGRGPQAESADARIGPRDIYPDPVRTPGAVNSEITQDDIDQTICNSQWSTRSVRPPAHYTNRLKFEQMQEYGDSDTDPRDYEEDHLIPLELGGNPTDPRNLWPEPFDTSISDGVPGRRIGSRITYTERSVLAISRLSKPNGRLRAIGTRFTSPRCARTDQLSQHFLRIQSAGSVEGSIAKIGERH
jgi:hypothetical protein